MDVPVLYFCSYIIPEIKSYYDIDWHSRAGLSKKKTALSSLKNEEFSVTVVSPIIPGGSKARFYGKRQFHDDEHDVDVIVPPTLNLFGLTPLNHAIATVLTILYSISLFVRFESPVSLFYNFRPEVALPGLMGKLLFGAPYVLQYEDGLFVHQSRLRRVTAKITKYLCNSSLDGAICTNTNLGDVLHTDNIGIVRGFPSIGMPDTLPSRKYADPNKVVVMFAGHFDSVRGIDMFLDVVPQIDSENVAFWISGTGRDDEKRRVRERVRQLNDDRVTYFGTLPWEEYRARVVSADILVNFQSPDEPISTYTFPSKLLDFMSAGRVVVSTDMSDLAEELSDEIVVDGTRIESIVFTLSETIERRKAGEADSGRIARNWIETHCTEEYAGKQYRKVIENAVAD